MHLTHSKYPDFTPPVAGPPLFEIGGLSHAYPDGTQALSDINLTVCEGDRIALVGKNSSGKSTLVRHLNGLLPVQQGSLRYRGEEVTPQIFSGLWRTIGILFQDPDNHLFCSTLYDDATFGPLNQGLPPEEADRLARSAVDAVGLGRLLHKPAHLLSYGQKKRAALAAILAMQPEVLILDEPTANLDPHQARILKDLLAGFPGTLIIIDHDLVFLYDICQRAIVLANGRVHHDYGIRDLVSHQQALREHGLDFTFRFECCGGPHGETAPASHHHHHIHHDHGPRNRHVADCSSVLPVLELQHFTFLYPDGTPGVSDINLTIYPGETLALVGENGAGKSTLAACLLGLNAGDGILFHQGRKIDRNDRREMWRHVGMVFQNSADQLFCPSCREEVAFGPRQLGLSAIEIENRVSQSLAVVRLSGFEDRVPLNLSGGERKRLAIAATLSMQPDVLILDEPTAGLDPESQELLLEIIERLGVTTVIITHDMFFIRRLSSRVAVIHQGRIIRDYPTIDFLSDTHLQLINGLDYTYENRCIGEIQALQQAAGNGR